MIPAGKDYFWGGTRLKDEFGKTINLNLLAETWECSTHPDGLSTVADGEFAGKTLQQVIKEHSEFLGRLSKFTDQLPILIKLIDAREKLSVQVHPDDEYARKKEHGQLGKSEMWYVLDAVPGAYVLCGLRRKTSWTELQKSIQNGTIESVLQKVLIHKGDVFYIEAGTIHAIGAGVLIAEIQENSNLTYRLYDYNRSDQNGRKRTLHVEKALDAAVLEKKDERRKSMHILRYKKGQVSELLCRCKYFEVYRMLIDTGCSRESVTYGADSSSFHVLLCIGGRGSITRENGACHNFYKGDCIFFPADSQTMRIHGRALFLDVRG